MEELIDPKIIQSEIKLFYSKLYDGCSQKAEQEYLNFLAELNTPKLSADDQKLCEGKLTVSKFWKRDFGTLCLQCRITKHQGMMG